MKRDFVAHASHELKSPLTAIRGYAELIELGMLESSEIKSVAGKITDQTKTMTALVEDMLMLSRLEHLKDGEKTDVHLDGVLRDVIGSLSILAKSKDISINADIEPIVFNGDVVDMRTLFKNLIENAIRYSHGHQSVEVSLKASSDTIDFVVRDHGIGIASEHRHRVFERFYRIDKGRIEGGTGLGLAIVKHITVKYQGSVDLQSDVGKGTTIKVSLPLSEDKA
jgi:two-component system, OmpR family, phosphate regulon sensor histidine kinase PhoR